LSVPVANYLGDGVLLQDVWGGATLKVVQGQVHRVRVPARSGVVLEATADLADQV
jgi:3-polyprenyl-4-hydroxybenzoate decarboxylase